MCTLHVRYYQCNINSKIAHLLQTPFFKSRDEFRIMFVLVNTHLCCIKRRFSWLLVTILQSLHLHKQLTSYIYIYKKLLWITHINKFLILSWEGRGDRKRGISHFQSAVALERVIFLTIPVHTSYGPRLSSVASPSPMDLSAQLPSSLSDVPPVMISEPLFPHVLFITPTGSHNTVSSPPPVNLTMQPVYVI